MESGFPHLRTPLDLKQIKLLVAVSHLPLIDLEMKLLELSGQLQHVCVEERQMQHFLCVTEFAPLVGLLCKDLVVGLVMAQKVWFG